MFYNKANPSTGTVIQVPKGIQRVLEERKLWPSNGLLLECPKQRCSKEPCQNSLKCKVCVKGSRCQSCKEKKVHSGACTPKRICDNCYRRKQRCGCVQKKACDPCKKRQTEGCKDCDSLPPKCNSESQSLFFFESLYHINLHMVIDCCARRLLSAQPDFQAQKSDIEETIEMKSYLVLYYPKFHCELNHIEYFWSHSKRYARENCNYHTRLRDCAKPFLLH